MNNITQYKNKLFSVLGDSISTFEGASLPKNAVYYDFAHKTASGVVTVSDTWWAQVIEQLGGQLLMNNSFSGSTVCRHPCYEIQSYSCSDERTASLGRHGITPDVIMVYMGTNDWGCGFRIVDSKCPDSYDNSALFLPAYRQMLIKLKSNYPNAEIWCFTLPISKCTTMTDYSFPYCYGGRHISEYCEAIRACAKEFNCRLIDLNKTANPFDTIDGFHPTASGMKTISSAVIKELYENT